MWQGISPFCFIVTADRAGEQRASPYTGAKPHCEPSRLPSGLIRCIMALPTVLGPASLTGTVPTEMIGGHCRGSMCSRHGTRANGRAPSHIDHVIDIIAEEHHAGGVRQFVELPGEGEGGWS